MKNIIIHTLMMVSFLSFGQTKSESEKWINDKIKLYEIQYSNESFKIKEYVFLENEYIFHYRKFEAYGNVSESWSALKLKDITTISYLKSQSSEIGNNFQIFFWCDKGKILKKELHKIDGSTPDTEYKIDSEMTSLRIQLSNKFIVDGMKPRMEKALKHIIKLYGGNVNIKLEKKEPF